MRLCIILLLDPEEVTISFELTKLLSLLLYPLSQALLLCLLALLALFFSDRARRSGLLLWRWAGSTCAPLPCLPIT